MAPKIRSVAIMTKRKNADAKKAAVFITKTLHAKSVDAFTINPLKIRGCASINLADVKDNVELIFAIGGDGTTLKAFRTIPGDLPLLSINVGGHRGILSEADTDSIEMAVSSILDGKCFYDSRIRIQASCGKTVFPPALNEILFTRASLTRTPTISIKLMGDELVHRMDGIVISTPTGSTGHSLSIGGPVLHEGMSCLILNPVAPVGGMPLLIIPVEEIVMKSSLESHLVVDGQEIFKIDAGDEVRISRYHTNARFLRLHKKGMRQLAKLGF